jgi:hypothetical protein
LEDYRSLYVIGTSLRRELRVRLVKQMRGRYAGADSHGFAGIGSVCAPSSAAASSSGNGRKQVQDMKLSG